MFERFTQDARSVVKEAVAQATHQGADRVGPEHLLLGIVSGGRTTTATQILSSLGADRERLEDVVLRREARLLEKLGIDLDEVKANVEKSFGPGAWKRGLKGGHIPFNQSAKKALDLSLREALKLKHRHIDDTHILLGLLDVGGTATESLTAVEVDPQELRRRLLDGLSAA